jgi:hypothetical protein
MRRVLSHTSYPPTLDCSCRVIRSSNGGVWIAAGVERTARLARFINRVTAQHIKWIEKLRQDILARANDWAPSGRHS